MKESSQDPAKGLQFKSHRECDTLTALVNDYFSRYPNMGHRSRHKKGAFVWNQGTRDHAIHILQRGQVLIVLNGSDGCEVILRVINPGELFGELCFCSKRQQFRENSARAATEIESLQLHYADFVTYLRKTPLALESFTLRLCERLAEAECRIEALSHRRAEARLGRLLLQLAKARALDGNLRESVSVAVGHSELAGMAAMTRPHLTVTMGKLRTRGLIDYGRRTQLKINIASLEDYIHGSPSTVRKPRALTR